MLLKTYTPTGRLKEKKLFDLEGSFGVDDNAVLTFTESDYDGDDKSKTIDLEITKEEFDRLSVFFRSK